MSLQHVHGLYAKHIEMEMVNLCCKGASPLQYLLGIHSWASCCRKRSEALGSFPMNRRDVVQCLARLAAPSQPSLTVL